MLINETKIKRTYSTYIVFTAFFIILLIQNQFLFLFWDDYGYASLSFINNIPNVDGTHFSFAQFIDFYYLHYLTATGRVIAQSLATITLSAGIWVARIAQCVAIILLLFTLYKIIVRSPKRNGFLAAIVVCCLYGLLEIYLFDKGIFWISASVTYLWPLAPLIIGCWIYYRYAVEKEQINKVIKILAVLCLLFSATAQEQLAVAQISMLSVILIIKFVKFKKINVFDVIVIACSIGGALFLMLAPAMAVRAEALSTLPNYANFTSMSLPQKIALDYPIILKYLFSRNFYFFTIAFFVCSSFVGWRLLKTNIGNQILNAALTIISFGSLASMIVFNDGLYSLMLQIGLSETFIYIFLTGFLMLFTFGVTMYYRKSNKKFVLISYYGAWVSILCIAVVIIPSSGRLYIPFVFLSFIFMGDIICEIIETIKSRHIKVIAVGLTLLIVYLNINAYTTKYYNLSPAKIQNDTLLRTISDEIKNGQDIKSVDIRYYPNIESDVFNQNEGILLMYGDSTIICIKEYYDLPESIIFNWQQ